VHDREPVVHEHVAPPGLAVTVYPVIVEPPSDAGAVHDTTLCAFAPLVPDTLVGRPGVVRGVTLTALDAAPVPALLTARSLIW